MSCVARELPVTHGHPVVNTRYQNPASLQLMTLRGTSWSPRVHVTSGVTPGAAHSVASDPCIVMHVRG